MSKVIITVGLPGSGKSTWAKEFALKRGDYKRVNRDDIRLMMHNQAFSPKKEKFVTEVENSLIHLSLADGFNVIIDATNLNKDKTHAKCMDIQKKHPNTECEIKSFLDVPIEQCVANDLKRPNSVGSDVIYGMYERYLVKKESCRNQPFEHAIDHKVVLVDIDGTLAHMNRKPFEWDKVIHDSVQVDVASLVNALKADGYKIVIMSGRDSICREDTEKWLDKIACVQYDKLYMRAEGDNRKDAIVKRELFDNHIANTGCNVALAIDDRPCMVRMYKEMGITVLNADNRIYMTEF